MPRRNRTLSAFGLNVLRRREAKGLTQEKLAENAELDRTFVSGVERGVRNPGLLTITRLAKALGVTTAELCSGVDR
jgi:transcriptional regulator with XRE-family HTH domain